MDQKNRTILVIAIAVTVVAAVFVSIVCRRSPAVRPK